MSVSKPAQQVGRRTKLTVRAAFVVANVAIIGVFIHQSLGTTVSSSGSSSASSADAAHRALGEGAGYVPAGTTVFDDIPAVANLDADLLVALRKASGNAGITFYVNSGWRSPEYQEQLLREAVAQYGSREEAARWVATPTTSPHVRGHAVDLGRSDAQAWLARHGAKYGLCQIYDNEPWHYELRPEAISGGCPKRYADPTHDPRMAR
jgi:hypothetical protein